MINRKVRKRNKNKKIKRKRKRLNKKEEVRQNGEVTYYLYQNYYYIFHSFTGRKRYQVVKLQLA